MTDTLRLTILGCGSSPGVPRPNGDWGDCDPNEPKNRRRRCAALFERVGPNGTTRIVVDCGPDFREQMLSAKVDRIDAVVLTHPHADHIHGIDDLRTFVLGEKRLVPVHADDPTFERVNEAFGYCFATPPGSNYPPIARHVRIEPGRDFAIDGPGGSIRFRPFEQTHGRIVSLGFRVGPFAYCSDVSDFPASAVGAIDGASHLVIDALQHKTHPSHLSLQQALGWIERLRVPNAVLTHMHTPLDYQALCASLPAHIRPAFDGMVLETEIG